MQNNQKEHCECNEQISVSLFLCLPSSLGKMNSTLTVWQLWIFQHLVSYSRYLRNLSFPFYCCNKFFFNLIFRKCKKNNEFWPRVFWYLYSTIFLQLPVATGETASKQWFHAGLNIKLPNAARFSLKSALFYHIYLETSIILRRDIQFLLKAFFVALATFPVSCWISFPHFLLLWSGV